jgi:hypothetical protein
VEVFARHAARLQPKEEVLLLGWGVPMPLSVRSRRYDDTFWLVWLSVGKSHGAGCIPRAINGMPDHIHVVLPIPPRLAVAVTIGQLKAIIFQYVPHPSRI